METNYKDKFEILQAAINQFFAACNPESDIQALISENETLKRKLQRRDYDINKLREARKEWSDTDKKRTKEIVDLQRQLREIRESDTANKKAVARLRAENETLQEVISVLQRADGHPGMKPATMRGNCSIISLTPQTK